MKCEKCKYYKEGLTVDYIPGHYCDLNVEDDTNCTKFNDQYTIGDYFLECWFGILLVFCILIANIISSIS